MRKILICTLLAAAFSAQAQIRTVGITYTAGAPTFTPSTQGSFIAYDTTGREFYEFFGGVWSKAGQNIDQIAGAVAPAYTPTKMDARFAINASGELYWWNGSAWVKISFNEPVPSVSFSANNSTVAAGRLQYSDDIGDFVFGGVGGTQLEVTQKHVYYVRNAEATTLAAGEVVYAFGTLGASGRITVKRYIANATIPSKYVIGIVAAPIAAGADGYAVDFGKIRGLNTDAFLDGDVLYASASNAGQLTATPPVAPNFRLPIAFVVHKSATVGVLAVRINGGYALEDLHNVAATTPNNGDVLTYNTSTLTWGPAAPADGSATNEGVLGVGAGGANTSTIISNTSGATGVTIAGTTSIAVTETTNSNGGTINIDVANQGVTFAKIQNIDGLSVIGRSANTTGVTAAITAGSDHQVLRRSDTGIGFGAIALNQSNAVTGTLGVGNGGTGAATTDAHYVFAGPTSGGAAAPSFRNLDRRDVSGGTSSRIPFYLSDGRLTDTVGFTWNRAVLNIEPSNGTVPTSNTFIRGGNTTTTGGSNVAVGTSALSNNTTGSSNVAMGGSVLLSNTTGSDNTAMGPSALRSNTTGGDNTAMGREALRSNTTGGNNTAIGTIALENNTTGILNSAIGRSALLNNRTGSNNTAMGPSALRSNTTGSDNTAMGINAGYNTTTADTLTGSNNTIIGAESARNIASAAAGNLVLGNSVNLPTGNGSNQVVIKNAIFATGASATGTTIPADGKVGIMVAAPSAYLHLRAGESGATRAPLKFTSGTNMTTPEAGAMEWNGTNLFLTNSTPTRQTINQGLTGSASLDFGNTNAGESADLTITVTGAADGDVVAIGVPNAAVNANTCYTAWVSAADTVTVRFNNYSGSAVNPASGTFKAFVTKF